MRVCEVDLTSHNLERIDDIAPLLADLDCLRRLSVSSVPDDWSNAFTQMAELTQLRTLDFSLIDAGDLVFAENEAALFARLSQLTELHVCSKEELDCTLRELIRSKLPNCRITDLHEP